MEVQKESLEDLYTKGAKEDLTILLALNSQALISFLLLFLLCLLSFSGQEGAIHLSQE